jgi:outer membrane protein TolC
MDMLVGAGLELFSEPKERLAVLDESVRYSQHVEKITALRHEAGTVPRSDVSRAKYIRATAEIRLLREKEKPKR